jgi:hypothetical protein
MYPRCNIILFSIEENKRGLPSKPRNKSSRYQSDNHGPAKRPRTARQRPVFKPRCQNNTNVRLNNNNNSVPSIPFFPFHRFASLLLLHPIQIKSFLSPLSTNPTRGKGACTTPRIASPWRPHRCRRQGASPAAPSSRNCRCDPATRYV